MVLLVAVPLYASSSLLWSRAASATNTTCAGRFRYGGYLTARYANRGVQGDINYVRNEMLLDDDYTDHGALYVDATSQYDSAIDVNTGGQYTYGWAQTGYFVGNSDGRDIDTTEVYAETLDLNGGPSIYLYPDLS